jgi:nicotinamidase-related amidase
MNNPNCELNIGDLLEAWRKQSWPVVFVKHNSLDERSPLNKSHPGNAFKPVIDGQPDLFIEKSTHSAFFGKPDLHSWLQNEGITSIAICGIQTNMCCESTARMASDLGYDVLFIIDATHTFDITPSDGQGIRARDVARTSALQLDGQFAQVVHTKGLIG